MQFNVRFLLTLTGVHGEVVWQFPADLELAGSPALLALDDALYGVLVHQLDLSERLVQN